MSRRGFAHALMDQCSAARHPTCGLHPLANQWGHGLVPGLHCPAVGSAHPLTARSPQPGPSDWTGASGARDSLVEAPLDQFDHGHGLLTVGEEPYHANRPHEPVALAAELLSQGARTTVIARVDGDRAALTAGRQRRHRTLGSMTLAPRRDPARCRAPKLAADRGEAAPTPLARCDALVTRRGLRHPVPNPPAGHDRRLHGEAGRIHSPVEFSTPSPRTPLPNFYYYLFTRLRLPHVPISSLRISAPTTLTRCGRW